MKHINDGIVLIQIFKRLRYLFESNKKMYKIYLEHIQFERILFYGHTILYVKNHFVKSQLIHFFVERYYRVGDHDQK